MHYPFLCYEITESNSEPTRLNISETIVRYDSQLFAFHTPFSWPSQSLDFSKKVSILLHTFACCNDTAYTRVFWFDYWLVWRYSSWSAHENTWMLRTSFTASWKTNNHSSSCTLQTEHHFILPIYICILNNITIECIKRKK